MQLSLRPAHDEELDFCEALNRRHMDVYRAARGIPWDAARFLASWAEFENLIIVADAEVAGALRLAPEQGGLGLRDLQIIPNRQRRGIGAWAVRQAQGLAASRGFCRLQLRVYEENPAMALYSRLGFKVESVAAGTIHMACELPSSA